MKFLEWIFLLPGVKKGNLMENKLINSLKKEINDKKVLVLGFGREGKENLNVIMRAGTCKEVAIADEREISINEIRIFLKNIKDEKNENCGSKDITNENTGEKENAKKITEDNIKIIKIISNEMEFADDFDIVFKSPGIVMPKPFSGYKATITSQAEYFLKVYGNQTIGITGTKGKSTTTTLIYHELKENGFDTVLLGNIGVPAFSLIDEMKENTKAVFELSCHQLEYGKYSPHTAVYLNVFPEHLDHYGTFEKYKAAKENIYKNQKKGDRLYCGTGVIPKETKSKVTVIYDLNRGDKLHDYGIDLEDINKGVTEKLAIPKAEHTQNNIIKLNYGVVTVEKNVVTEYELPKKEPMLEKAVLSIDENATSLKGFHNFFDISVAFAVCNDLGVKSDGFKKALETYKPLPHRLEFAGEFDGIKFYDDSISTIPKTAIEAMNTIKDTDTVILGGMDRGIDYTPLIEYLENSDISNIILMEATGHRIAEEIKKFHNKLYNSGRIKLVNHLEDAVKLSKEITSKGKSCVMSPAAASYGTFKNFEERGEKYKSYIIGKQKYMQ